MFHIFVAEKRAAAQMAAASNTKTTMSYTTAIMTSGKPTKMVTSTTTQTFAAKLTEATATFQLPSAVASATVVGKSRTTQSQLGTTHSLSTTSAPSQGSCQQHVNITATASTVPSPKHHRPLPAASAPPNIPGQYQMTPGKAPFSSTGPISMSNPPSQVPSATAAVVPSVASSSNQGRSNTPLNQPSDQHQLQQQQQAVPVPASTPPEYSLFNDTFTKVIIG